MRQILVQQQYHFHYPMQRSPRSGRRLASRLKEDSNKRIPHDAMGDRQRPARIEHDAAIRALDPIDAQVSEVDYVIRPGVDGDGIAGSVVDAGAIDSRDADRFGDDYGAVIRRIERLDLATGIGLAGRELEGPAGICGRFASAGIGAFARDKGHFRKRLCRNGAKARQG